MVINLTKEKYIGSSVSEILLYRQTNRRTEILLLYNKDKPGGKGTLNMIMMVQKNYSHVL